MDDEITVKVVFVGSSGAGKTCIISKYVNGIFLASNSSTIGASYFSKTVQFQGKTYNINIWDTAGQELYKSLAPMYYRGAVASFVVYDAANYQSFIEAESWIKELRTNAPQTLIILCANKIDLVDERKVNYDEGFKLASEQKAKYVETSALSGAGVEQAFEIVFSYVSAQPNVVSEPVKPLVPATNTEEKKCEC
ncbi:small GTP-binding protein [Histomonas meleagridis]|uniref:small GTP-binding protein n=1 Tax=Histomonas meleagridis TaxID=135588 RepID=UPI003559FAFF|nr:small GTP-binding protein [Histomonas meleagridis]KAH0800872.1 small GTP-binding protein [Histomonas meleagridis]